MPNLRNIRLVIIALLISMLHLTLVIAAEDGLSFSVRLFGEGYNDDNQSDNNRGADGGAWKGNNETSGTGFKSTEGQQMALSGVYQHGQFYTGLNIKFGEKYTFKGDAPDQVTPTGTTKVSDDKIEHNELDVIFGYYMNEYASLFLDIKSVSDTWESNRHHQTFNGLGFGVTGLWPIINSLTLYGSSGFILSGAIKANDQKVGKGQGLALDIGLMYAVNQSHRLMIGSKESYYVYKFDAGDEQTHRMSALYIGYSYAFAL